MENHIPINDLVSLENDYQTQRTIEEVIDVETGEIVYAEDFFAQDEAIIIRARAILEISIQSDMPKYKCLFCEQKVKISGRRVFEREKTVYFFAHFKDSDDCPIKTGIGLSLDILLAKKYHGLKESELHLNLKALIADRLQAETAIEKGVRDVCVEKIFKNLEVSDNWRRPDVKATFNDKSLVFELQLSTTFLSVVIGRDAFYRKNQTFIIWVFGVFSEEEDWQKLMEKDIYYAHKRNVFLLDSVAKEASEEKGELVLHCYWQTPKIIDGKVRITWHKKLITLDELTYDNEIYEVYYYNSDKDFYDIADPKEKAIIEAWDKAKEERWDKIKHNIEKRELSKEQQEKYEKRLELKEKEILIKIANKEIIPTRFNKDGLWGYKYKNHIIIEPKYVSAGAFKNGVAITKDGNNDKYIIDLSGDEIIELGEVRVLDVSLFNEYYLKITTEYENEFNDKLGKWRKTKVENIDIYHPNGQVMFNNVKNFIDGRAKVMSNNKWGYINEKAEIIIPFEYDEIQDFIDSKAKTKKNNKWGYIDEKAEIVIPFEYDEIQGFIDGKAKIMKNNKWGHIDESGNELIPCIYDKIGYTIDGKIQVTINGKSGCVNEKGIAQIDTILPFINGLNKVKKMGLWGLSSVDGSEKTPCVYDKIESFANGKFSVFVINKVSQIVDFEEKIIAKLEDENILDISFWSINHFKVNVERIYNKGYGGGKYQISKIFDFSGKILCEEIRNFSNGKAKAMKNDKWGFIDETGIVIVPMIFSEQMASEVTNVKDINGGKIYENANGGFIIPSLSYLGDKNVLDFFKTTPIKAKVESRADFGVFLSINFEIKKGLLHNNEIFKAKLNPNDSQFKTGNLIDVYVRYVDIFNEKISFSLLSSESEFYQKTNINRQLVGTIAPELRELKIKGRIDIDKYIEREKEVNLAYATEKRAVREQERAAIREKEQEKDSLYQEIKKLEGNIVEGKITNIKEYGLLVEICENGIGLLHISNLKRNGFDEKNLDKDFNRGDNINVVVISVQVEKRRIELGYIKQ